MKIIYLTPRASFRNPLRSDTLFGLLIWGIKQIYGDAAVSETIALFDEGKPPFLLSSAMPFLNEGKEKILYFPKLAIPPVSGEVTPDRMDDFKAYKKLRWIPRDMFNNIRRGKISVEEFFDGGDWKKIVPPFPGTQPVMHNVINRLSNASDNLFYTEEYFFPNGGLFFLLDILQESYEAYFKGIFQLYSHIGFGGDASVGKGHFHFEMEEYDEDLKLDNAEHLINLSLYMPVDEELKEYRQRPEAVWYQIEMRKGKIGGRLFVTNDVWKKSVNVFREGGCFPRINDQQVYGSFPIVKEKNPPAQPFDVYYNGYALMAGYKKNGGPLMNLTIRALSPIHIGTGNSLEPFDYYFLPNRVFVIDHEACLEAIYGKHPAGVTQFSEWIEKTSREISEANKARRRKGQFRGQNPNEILKQLRAGFNIIDFTEKVLKDRELADIFRKEERFRLYEGYCPERPRNIMQLKEVIKTNGELFIPGSSIKGAIRTALAYQVIFRMDEEESRQFLKPQQYDSDGFFSMLEQIRSASAETVAALQESDTYKHGKALSKLNSLRRKFDKQIGAEIERFVFGCGDRKGERAKWDNPQFDIMRLIHVSDTKKSHAEILFSDMKSFTYKHEEKRMFGQPLSLTEFIDTGSEFQFSIEVDSQTIRKLSTRGNSSDWIGFEEKFQRLFGIEANELQSLSPQALEERIVNSILSAIRVFGEAVKKREQEWLARFKPQEVEELQKLFQQKMDKPGSYTKIGYASGWFATTVGLAIANNDHLQHSFPEVIYAFNLDLIWKKERLLNRPQRNKKDIETQVGLLNRSVREERFPGSRRLTAERWNPSEYIGWIEITREPMQASSTKEHKTKTDELAVVVEKEEGFADQLEKLKEKFGK